MIVISSSNKPIQINDISNEVILKLMNDPQNKWPNGNITYKNCWHCVQIRNTKDEPCPHCNESATPF